MKQCPYCKKPIKDNWRFCHYCNKPLITNLNLEKNNHMPDHYDSYRSEQPYEYNSDKDFDVNIIEDKGIDEKIHQIEKQITNQPYGESIGSLFLEKAALYYKKRDLSKSLKDLERALDHFEKENNHIKVAVAHNEIGLIKEELGYFDDSIYHFDRAINLFQEMEDNLKIIQVFNNIGNAYFQLKDIENAYKYYQKAIELAEKENMKYEEIKSSSNIVEILFILQDYDRIKKILNKNYEFFKQNNDIFGLITTYSKYGKLYFYLGENYYEKAYEYLKKSLDLIGNIDSQISPYSKSRMQWEVFLFLGKIKILWNNYWEAENFLLKSLESVRTFEIEEDNIKESIILEAIANLYEIMDEYKKAIEYFNLSSEIYYKFGEDFKTAELKTKVAHIYHNNLKQKIDAIDYYEQALEIFRSLNYFKEMAKIYENLGDLYIERNLTDIAIHNFEQAKEYYQEINDTYHIDLVNEKINTLLE